MASLHVSFFNLSLRYMFAEAFFTGPKKSLKRKKPVPIIPFRYVVCFHRDGPC